jgi:hypothetical protein
MSRLAGLLIDLDLFLFCRRSILYDKNTGFKASECRTC